MSTSERDVSVERFGRMSTSEKSSLISWSMCMVAFVETLFEHRLAGGEPLADLATGLVVRHAEDEALQRLQAVRHALHLAVPVVLRILEVPLRARIPGVDRA